MGVTIDYCPINATFPITNNSTFIVDEVLSVERLSDHQENSLIGFYQISAYWSLIFTTFLTISVGVAVSLLTGEKRTCAENFPLTSKVALRLWRKLRLLPKAEAEIPAKVEEDEDEKDILRHEFRRDESFDSNESNV
ncbi:hypothetical protein MTO96_049639 [Rhipicephalus appendiculatus]